MLSIYLLCYLFSQGFLGLFGWNTVDSEAKEVCFVYSTLLSKIFNSTIQLNNFISHYKFCELAALAMCILYINQT